MILERKTFIGTIAWDGKSFPVAFSAWSDDDFHLQIEIEPIALEAALILSPAMGKPASFSESLTLEGRSQAGETFFSDTLQMNGWNIGTSGNAIRVSARAAEIMMPSDLPAPRPSMKLWFRSFKSFRTASVETSFGSLVVAGEHRKVAKNDVSGWIAIEGKGDVDSADWVQKADKFLTFMHRGLCFAHGGRLQTPLREVFEGNFWKATFYEGKGFSRGLPAILNLQQRPIIQALAKRYEEPRPFPDMLWEALGLMHIEAPFDEVRFLTAITALEAILEHVMPEKLTAIMPKPEFRQVQATLLEALGHCGLELTTKQSLEDKLKFLNKRDLYQKVQSLRDHYSLSPIVFTDEAIKNMIRARNELVHTGVTGGRRTIWPHVVFLRELISQIVFHEIGYGGPYLSYIDGYKVVHPEVPPVAPGGDSDDGLTAAQTPTETARA